MPIDNSDEIIPKVNTGESLTRTYRVFFSSELEEGYIDLPIIIGYDGTEIKKKLEYL